VISHGIARGRWVRRNTFSAATRAIDRPTSAPTSWASGRAQPSTATLSVMLCAMVNPVITVATSPRRAAIRMSASTKAR
jgi:hypothetical protein